MRRYVLLAMILLSVVAVGAVDKTGLFHIGGRAGFWAPQGDFNDAVSPDGYVGLSAGIGFAEAWSIVLSGAYDFGGANKDFFDSAFEEAPEDFDPEYGMWEAHFGLRWNLTPRSRFDPFIEVGAGYFDFPCYKRVDDDGDGYAEYLDTELDPELGGAYGAYIAVGGEYFTDSYLSLEFEVAYDAVFNFPVPRRITDSEQDLRYYFYEEQLLHNLDFGIGVNLYF